MTGRSRQPWSALQWRPVPLYSIGKAISRYKAEIAKVAELVDALDLGSSAARRESSSLSFRTITGAQLLKCGDP